MTSLQDQLLKAGIVSKDKAKKIGKEKRKQARQTPKGEIKVDQAKADAKRALVAKTELDRERGKAQQAKADKKAVHAQVVQLVKNNTIDRTRGETAYQFSDGKKIKKIYVTSDQQSELVRGQLAIAKPGDEYALVPRQIAEKIQQREDYIIILLNKREDSKLDGDDPYAQYQIPDDLMW